MTFRNLWQLFILLILDIEGMELINLPTSKESEEYFDVDLIKKQIQGLVNRGYVGGYGRHLDYKKKQGRKMLARLKEAGVNCELMDYDKTLVRIVFTDLVGLPDYVEKSNLKTTNL